GLGQNAEAVEALGTCVALRPKTPWGYSARAMALASSRRFGEAQADVDEALRLDPEFLPAQLYRGIVRWQKKDYPQAPADFAAVVAPADGPGLPEARFSRGQLYLERHEYDKALADFDWLVEKKLANRTVYLHRARVFLAQSKVEDCLESLTHYLTGSEPLDPK